MNSIIRDFYQRNGFPVALINNKLLAFERHPDIEREFVYWIQNGIFMDENKCSCVEGYTAESISRKSPLLNGDSAFVLLIELIENKQRAQKLLKSQIEIK